MKNLLFTLVLSLTIPLSQAEICRLETPIKVSELSLSTNPVTYDHETFSRVKTVPSLDSEKEIELNITFPKNMNFNSWDAQKEFNILGARVQYKGTMDFFGVTNGYGGVELERTVNRLQDTRTNEIGDLHTVRVLYPTPESPELPYVKSMSEVWVVNGEIKSVELFEESRRFCVTRASR